MCLVVLELSGKAQMFAWQYLFWEADSLEEVTFDGILLEPAVRAAGASGRSHGFWADESRPHWVCDLT